MTHIFFLFSIDLIQRRKWIRYVRTTYKRNEQIWFIGRIQMTVSSNKSIFLFAWFFTCVELFVFYWRDARRHLIIVFDICEKKERNVNDDNFWSNVYVTFLFVSLLSPSSSSSSSVVWQLARVVVWSSAYLLRYLLLLIGDSFSKMFSKYLFLCFLYITNQWMR